ncbi:MAG: XdhC family protein [Gammaproteobacteria bacterium]
MAIATAGPRVVVEALITEVRGSAPVNPGDSLQLTRNEQWQGTVGGGQLEWALQAAMVSRPDRPRLLNFTLGAATDQCCGGRVEAHVIPVATSLAPLYAAPCTRLYRRDENGPLRLAGGYDVDGRWLGEPADNTPPRLARDIPGTSADGRWFVRPAHRPIPLWLFGGGHVARAVARLAVELGYGLRVFDGRPEWADPAAFPPQTQVHTLSQPPADLRPDHDTVVLVMTHSHSLDYALLKHFLRHRLAYLGVIGSRSKAARFRHALRREGLDDSGLHMPIGVMDLGKRPSEIAVSVLAELLALRTRRPETARVTAEDTPRA